MIHVNHDTLGAFFAAAHHNLCMGIGKALRAARNAKRLRQEDVAKACGWKDGQNRLSNYEMDKREPSIEDLRKLAEVLETTPGALIAGGGVDPVEDAMRIAAMLVTLSPEARAPLEAGIAEAYRRRSQNDEVAAAAAPPAAPEKAHGQEVSESRHLTKPQFSRAIKKMGLGGKR